MKNIIEVVAFDLDGTLLTDSKMVSNTDTTNLNRLGEHGIIRVAATGRNLFSINRILPEDFPMDYAIFSSGAGIYNWKTKEILNTWHLNKTEIEQAVKTILPLNLNFTINKSIPDNHHMLAHFKHKNADDLIDYSKFYIEYLNELKLDELPTKATQLITLLNNRTELYKYITSELSNLKTILTTSPVNRKSMWIEIFNSEVSKGNGLKWLCKMLDINIKKSFGIGNDYNDIDLLDVTNYSFVVSNAPNELQKAYTPTQSNNKSGFSCALNTLI